MHPAILALLFFLASTGEAKVINTDVKSSYITKVKTGVAQSAEWLMQMTIGGERPTRPPRKVKLALVGLGRTGSTSFSVALKQLGYAPIHDDEAMEVSDIYSAMMDKSMTMDEVNIAVGSRGFDAPMVSLPEYVEWAATAPDVKVILTVRDASKWARSWLSVVPVAFIPSQKPFSWLKMFQELAGFNWEVMVNIPTNNHPEKYDDIPTLEAGFESWTEFVRKTVPSDRLLEFDVRQGWKPLCDFLGEPVPDGAFPHINDRAVVDVIVKVFVAITWIWPLLFAMPLLVAYFLIRNCLRGRKVKGKMD